MLNWLSRSRVGYFNSPITTVFLLFGLCLLMIAFSIPAFGQLTKADIEKMREQGKQEGWSFTVDEFPAVNLPLYKPEVSPPAHEISDVIKRVKVANLQPLRDLPDRFDWRDSSACTPIKDQADPNWCASCWAFACCAVIESQVIIHDGLVTDLSEQWLVSCTESGDCGFWNDWYGQCYDYMQLNGDTDPCGDWGCVTEQEFPYSGTNEACGCPYDHPYWIDSYELIVPYGQRPTIEQIKTAIYTYGPVSCNIIWDGPFVGYSGGIFDDENNTGSLNHSVVLVGWDDNQGTEGIWFLRNSTGTDWGEEGYMRIEYECHRVGWNTVFVHYTPQSGMRVTPMTNLTAEGPEGGPFTPSSKNYLIENLDDSSLTYSVSNIQPWIDISNSSGVLAAHDTVTVTVSFNDNANSLSNGQYTDVVSFVNETNHDGDTQRDVNLTVGMDVVYEWSLDTDPGWTTEGLWAFGTPTGQGGQYGGPDPTSGYTGACVYGYNLDGDYENNLVETHLTTESFDCSQIYNTRLRFQRWLGVEQPAYDHAYIKLSTDGVNWEIIWENKGEVADTSWHRYDIDISAYADGEETVYLRWTIGPTDGSWQYCGWNIDDIQIFGIPVEQSPLIFSYPDGRPDYVDPDGGTYFRVEVLPSSANPKPNSGRLYYNSGDGWYNILMQEISPNYYQVYFPDFECGADINYVVTAQTMGGATIPDPPGAPSNTYSAFAAEGFEVAYSDDFSADLGWSGLGGDGEWTMDAATGGAGDDQYGGPDPAEDHSPTSDNRVLGNDLTSGTGGDYNPGIVETQWITSPVIDCSDYIGVTMSFYRWLGIERNDYDHVYLEAFDGTDWVQLFENGSSHIDEDQWNLVEYNLNDIADGNADFQIRFGIGPTDDSWQYCGWNIDDLEIRGYSCTGSSTPAVQVDMIPDDPPITIPKGGSFTFTGILENTTDELQVVDVWVTVRLPNGTVYRPIEEFYDIHLQPYAYVSVPNVSQSIPLFAPVGDYGYLAFCGFYPNVVISEAEFPFTVIESMGKGGANDWTLSGWFDEREVNIPLVTELRGNYPNPFNPSTVIDYDISTGGQVKLEVFNLMGQKVETLVDGYQTAGQKSVNWEASQYSSGIYFYRLTTDNYSKTKRMTLLK
ncbi:MAG: T9SS type A sorting domain-containing protein [candidate division Zixibacteria bacterium]|nr:T9SS type A sorting domain-containing protein [candidate division Zixibacteria bacterium]